MAPGAPARTRGAARGSAPVFEGDGGAPRGERCVGEELLGSAFKLDASGWDEGAAADLGGLSPCAGWGGAVLRCSRSKEPLLGIEWRWKRTATYRDEEAGGAVQLDPLVPAVAAPLEGDGDDLADRRLWGGELTDTD